MYYRIKWNSRKFQSNFSANPLQWISKIRVPFKIESDTKHMQNISSTNKKTTLKKPKTFKRRSEKKAANFHAKKRWCVILSHDQFPLNNKLEAKKWRKQSFRMRKWWGQIKPRRKVENTWKTKRYSYLFYN